MSKICLLGEFLCSVLKKKIKEDKNNKKKGKGCGLALLPKVLKLRVLEKFPFKNYKLPNSPEPKSPAKCFRAL